MDETAEAHPGQRHASAEVEEAHLGQRRGDGCTGPEAGGVPVAGLIRPPLFILG